MIFSSVKAAPQALGIRRNAGMTYRQTESLTLANRTAKRSRRKAA